MPSADHIRQRKFPKSALDALSSAAGIVLRDLQAGSPHMEVVLTLHWGCDEFVMWVEVKSLCSEGQLFPVSCSVLHLASTRESGLVVPFL